MKADSKIIKDNDTPSVMQANLGRLLFNFGVVVLFMALIPLPFLEPGSAEFVVDLIGLVIDIIFLVVVYIDIRRQSRFKA